MSVILSDWQLLDGRRGPKTHMPLEHHHEASEIRHLSLGDYKAWVGGLLRPQAGSRLEMHPDRRLCHDVMPWNKMNGRSQCPQTHQQQEMVLSGWRNSVCVSLVLQEGKSPWCDPGECEEMRRVQGQTRDLFNGEENTSALRAWATDLSSGQQKIVLSLGLQPRLSL